MCSSKTAAEKSVCRSFSVAPDGDVRDAHGTRHGGNDHCDRGGVHFAGCGNRRFAGEIRYRQIRTLDAKGTETLVGGATAGVRKLRPVVYQGFASEVILRSRFPGEV